MTGRWTAYTVLTVCVILALTSGTNGEEIPEYRITLDPDDRYNVTWSFSGHTPDDLITFTVRFYELMGIFINR